MSKPEWGGTETKTQKNTSVICLVSGSPSRRETLQLRALKYVSIVIPNKKNRQEWYTDLFDPVEGIHFIIREVMEQDI